MATRTPVKGLEAFTIRGAMRAPGRGELDPITVILQDHGEGRGNLIVTCYASSWACSWTCYWGAMGNRTTTLRKFMAGANADYIATCLIRGRNFTNQYAQKREFEYLLDITSAIKASITTEPEHG